VKKRFFFLPFLVLFLFACKNPVGPSNNSPPAPSGGAIKAKVLFDASKIKCSQNGTVISSGTLVQEKDWIHFHAMLDENTEIIKAWYCNDIDQDIISSDWSTMITGSMMADDTDGQKVIKVRYTIK